MFVSIVPPTVAPFSLPESSLGDQQQNFNRGGHTIKGVGPGQEQNLCMPLAHLKGGSAVPLQSQERGENLSCKTTTPNHGTGGVCPGSHILS